MEQQRVSFHLIPSHSISLMHGGLFLVLGVLHRAACRLLKPGLKLGNGEHLHTCGVPNLEFVIEKRGI